MANQADLRLYHTTLLKKLAETLKGNTKPLRVKKKTISNLFRYQERNNLNRREIDLSDFSQPLYFDQKEKTLDVQGLATFETIVDFTLPYGYLPLITPELKHITIGGAIVGIGIESNTYRYGFVHNSLLEADVLLPDGRIVTCSATKQYSDLFSGLPNSYGTLGYILRAKIKLRETKPYIQLTTKRFEKLKSYLDAMKYAASDQSIDVIEGLAYTKQDLYLTTGKETTSTTNVKTIYGNAQFYKDISKEGSFSLPTKEYLFRYDPEWFWNMPNTHFFTIFRKLAPRKLRNSAFYTRYAQLTKTFSSQKQNDQLEQLIQDWEIPWDYAEAFVNFIFDTVDLNGKPLALVLVKVPQHVASYPIKEKQLYVNVGSYSFIKRSPNQEQYHATKAIDTFCFAHEGLKMLYSTTFINEPQFNKIYNGKAYTQLKKRYDPLNLAPTLYQKAVKAY